MDFYFIFGTFSQCAHPGQYVALLVVIVKLEGSNSRLSFISVTCEGYAKEKAEISTRCVFWYAGLNSCWCFCAIFLSLYSK